MRLENRLGDRRRGDYRRPNRAVAANDQTPPVVLRLLVRADAHDCLWARLALQEAGVAQLVEQLIRNQQVIGSSPIAGSSRPQQIRGIPKELTDRHPA